MQLPQPLRRAPVQRQPLPVAPTLDTGGVAGTSHSSPPQAGPSTQAPPRRRRPPPPSRNRLPHGPPPTILSRFDHHEISHNGFLTTVDVTLRRDLDRIEASERSDHDHLWPPNNTPAPSSSSEEEVPASQEQVLASQMQAPDSEEVVPDSQDEAPAALVAETPIIAFQFGHSLIVNDPSTALPSAIAAAAAASPIAAASVISLPATNEFSQVPTSMMLSDGSVSNASTSYDSFPELSQSEEIALTNHLQQLDQQAQQEQQSETESSDDAMDIVTSTDSLAPPPYHA